MFKPLPLFVGLRYTRAKRQSHFVSFISLVSMLGIALGVMVLITVISVMNGFETELRNRILSMVSHGVISGKHERLADWETLSPLVKKHTEVKGSAPFIKGEVMVTVPGLVSGAMIRGVLPEQERGVSEVAQHMLAGELESLSAGKYRAVIGKELAYALGVWTGDHITLVAPQVSMTAAGIIPRLRRFEITGIFEVGMYEYDRGFVFVHLQDAGKLFRMGSDISGLRLKFDNLYDAPTAVGQIAASLPGQYYVTDWTRQHANFFRAIQIERTAMFFILLLLVAIAAFNLVSTLVMVVTDKQADIAILRTLGMSPGGILMVFITQGALIGLMGTVLGLISGVSLALNVETLVPAIENFFGIEFLASDVYYISDLPSELHSSDVVMIGATALFLTLVATLYPAWRAAKTEPVEALRYE